MEYQRFTHERVVAAYKDAGMLFDPRVYLQPESCGAFRGCGVVAVAAAAVGGGAAAYGRFGADDNDAEYATTIGALVGVPPAYVRGFSAGFSGYTDTDYDAAAGDYAIGVADGKAARAAVSAAVLAGEIPAAVDDGFSRT